MGEAHNEALAAGEVGRTPLVRLVDNYDRKRACILPAMRSHDYENDRRYDEAEVIWEILVETRVFILNSADEEKFIQIREDSLT